jgi:hypothetical protein
MPTEVKAIEHEVEVKAPAGPLEKAKGAVITMVNVKLRQFNKPFLLALLVLSLQLPVLLVVFGYLHNQCITRSLSTPDAATMLMEYVKLGMPCIEKSYTSLKLKTPNPSIGQVMDLIRMQECKFGGGEGATLGSMSFCSAADKARHSDTDYFPPDDSVGCPWSPATECEGLGRDLAGLAADGERPSLHDGKPAVPASLVSDYVGCLNHAAESGEPYNLAEPACLDEGEYSSNLCGNYVGNQLLYYRECPSTAAVGGATLGYAGIVEFVITCACVGILWMLGVVKVNDREKTNIKDWIKQAYKDEFGEEKKKDNEANKGP